MDYDWIEPFLLILAVCAVIVLVFATAFIVALVLP